MPFWQRRLRDAARTAPSAECRELFARAGSGVRGLQEVAASAGWKPWPLLAQLLSFAAQTEGVATGGEDQGPSAGGLGFSLWSGVALGVAFGLLLLGLGLGLRARRGPGSEATHAKQGQRSAEHLEWRRGVGPGQEQYAAKGYRAGAKGPARWVGSRRWAGRGWRHKRALERRAEARAEEAEEAAQEDAAAEERRPALLAAAAAALFGGALGGGAGAGRRWERAAQRLARAGADLAALEERALRPGEAARLLHAPSRPRPSPSWPGTPGVPPPARAFLPTKRDRLRRAFALLAAALPTGCRQEHTSAR